MEKEYTEIKKQFEEFENGTHDLILGDWPKIEAVARRFGETAYQLEYDTDPRIASLGWSISRTLNKIEQRLNPEYRSTADDPHVSMIYCVSLYRFI